MLIGTIKFFNKSKGFGFITSDAGGKEVFLPSATVTASGLKKVEPGQRVSFEEQADVKGPKATTLALLDEPRRAPPAPPVPSAQSAQAPAQSRSAAAATLYCDPASRNCETVRDALAAEKLDVALVDVTATPPEPAELKKWSLALSGSDTGLVRRSDPLFFALQLDDRFISESDFWLAISQHPTLINGPVVKTGNKLAICKSAEDVRRLLGAQETSVAPKPKGISARLSALMRGETPPPIEDDEDEDEIEDDLVEAAPVTAEAEPEQDVAKPVKAAARKAVAKPKAAPAGKAEAKAKPAPAKKAAAKKR